MKKCICLLLSLLLAAVCCGCGGEDAENSADSERLTYYYTKEYRDDMVEVIERYNRWCTSHSSDDMRIRLVEFDNFNTMSERLNIEVMSGGGPDLFSNYMDLPFEKLMQSGAFYDLNELIDSDRSADRIDLENYNQTIMNAGVYNGKRYCIPAFYRVETLTGEKKTFEKYHMPTEQGYHLSFDNMDEVFEDYLRYPDGCRFLSGDKASGAMTVDTIALKLVDGCVDFEAQQAEFDDTFKEKLELLCELRRRSTLSSEDDSAVHDDSPTLFNPDYRTSNPVWMEIQMDMSDYLGITDGLKEPVLYPCFEKDADTYSADIVYAIFVNANTEKGDKALGFIKYLLGERLQNLYTGTEEGFVWGVDCLPVLNSAFDNCVENAYLIFDPTGDTIGKKEQLSPTTRALIEHVNKINSVSLYYDLSLSNYNKNVAIPILQDYWDGRIDVNKCVDNLSSATRIYILE